MGTLWQWLLKKSSQTTIPSYWQILSGSFEGSIKLSLVAFFARWCRSSSNGFQLFLFGFPAVAAPLMMMPTILFTAFTNKAIDILYSKDFESPAHCLSIAVNVIVFFGKYKFNGEHSSLLIILKPSPTVSNGSWLKTNCCRQFFSPTFWRFSNFAHKKATLLLKSYFSM